MGNFYLYFKLSKVSGHFLYHFFYPKLVQVLQTNSKLKSSCFMRASLSNSSNPVSKQICLSLPEEAVNIFLQLNSLGYISRKLCSIIFFPSQPSKDRYLLPVAANKGLHHHILQSSQAPSTAKENIIYVRISQDLVCFSSVVR